MDAKTDIGIDILTDDVLVRETPTVIETEVMIEMGGGMMLGEKMKAREGATLGRRKGIGTEGTQMIMTVITTHLGAMIEIEGVIIEIEMTIEDRPVCILVVDTIVFCL